MTYFIFLFRAKLRRCTAIFRKIKDRIITKAVRSRRLMRNPSLDRLPYYVYASVRKYSRYRTYESRSTLFIRNPFQTIQKNTVFNIIGCVFPCKSCRINSRSFIEIIDFQPGVIRKSMDLLLRIRRTANVLRKKKLFRNYIKNSETPLKIWIVGRRI